jgi:TPR repeat protein
VADEYVCPITAELPIDPVIAEDGRCYERHAIEEWFSRQPEPQVKSPVTNEPMGKRLVPAVQVRNSLKRLVESGAISGSKADAWKQAMAEEAEVVTLRAEAEGGDAESMCALARLYAAGTHGLRKDFAQSFKWYKRAADLKDVEGLTNCAVSYLNGEGVERSCPRGIAMLGAAAALGSEHACALLGEVNAEGRHGFDKDPQEATRWYREMQECDTRDSLDEHREQAAAWLREHP